MGVSDHIFYIFSTQVLGFLSLAISAIHVYKYYCKEEAWCIPGIKRPTYLARSLNWFVFGVALFLFPHIDLVQGRALLRVALAFMLLSEISYNLPYLIDMIKDIPKAPKFISRKIKDLL